MAATTRRARKTPVRRRQRSKALARRRRTRLGRTRLGRTRRTRLGRTRLGRTRMGRTRLGRTRMGRTRLGRTRMRKTNRQAKYGKKRSTAKASNRIQMRLDSVEMTDGAQSMLHVCLHALYRKVSMAAERMRKKKRHVFITVADIRSALKKIMPPKPDGKTTRPIRI